MTRSRKLYGFLLVQLLAYILILTTGGIVLRCVSYGAILLCLAYGLSFWKKGNRWVQIGLVFTAMADFCLVICDPIQQLWGMVFFLGAQTCYALFLYSRQKSKALLWLRGALSVAAILLTVLILGKNCDGLALVSMVYYANLIMNIIHAFFLFHKQKIPAIAFVLFLLCDTVIGLQVAAGGYLPIGEGSLLYRILFMDFNLSWFFYLPSQVLLAICARQKEGL